MKKDSEYRLVWASVKGELHNKLNIPCQDSCSVKQITEKWGIAAVSDGAGSALNSEMGSKFIVETAINYFNDYIIRSELNPSITTEIIWREFCLNCIKNIKRELKIFSDQNNYEYESLASTLLLILFSSERLLFINIGDGRAGYKNRAGDWLPAIKPFKGEEANATVFVTSDLFANEELYIETNIIEHAVAFCLLTDGMEKICYEVNVLNETLNHYEDLNKPYKKFFDPCIQKLNEFDTSEFAEVNKLWANFLEKGTETIKRENDDKTLIIGYLSSWLENNNNIFEIIENK